MALRQLQHLEVKLGFREVEELLGLKNEPILLLAKSVIKFIEALKNSPIHHLTLVVKLMINLNV